MKKSLFPILFLLTAFAIVLFAETSLFEDVHVDGILTVTNHTSTVTISSQGFAGLTDPGHFAIHSKNASALDNVFEIYQSPAAGVGNFTIYGGGDAAGAILGAGGTGGSRTLTLGTGAPIIQIGYTGGSGTISLGDGSSDILIINASTASTPNGLNLNSSQWIFPSSPTGVTSNGSGGITSLGTVTASNFVQATGSIGGYVGNGAFLTNLPGTSVGGFTPGSTIFAGASGALSQDNANYFWDITNRRLGLGTSSPGALLGMVVTNGVQNFIMMDGYSSTPDLITRTANGTFASPTAVTNGQILSAFSARGYGTTGFPTFGSARIRFEASEAFTDTAKGSRIVFFTTPSTTTNVTEAMRIHNDGSVGIGTNALIASVKLDVNGPLQVEGPAIITSSGPITNIIGSVSGLIPSVYITNVSCDFPSTLTLAGADLSFTIPATILTNSVVTIGRPPTEITGLVTMGLMTNNGIVVIRARNVTAGTIDQAALPYRIQVTVNPTQ